MILVFAGWVNLVDADRCDVPKKPEGCPCKNKDQCAGQEPSCWIDDRCTDLECLSENDKVLRANGELALLRDIVIGDYIFDGKSFTKTLAVEYGPKQNMLKLFMTNINNLSDNTTVTMTSNHLLYNVKNELISANDIEVNDVIFNDYIVNIIESDLQYSSTPITFSGYLQVNGIKVSSYVHSPKLAQLLHEFLSTFRWLSENFNEQISGKILEQMLKQGSPRQYYEMFKGLLGEEIIDNQLWFTLIAIPTVILILLSNPTALLTFFGTALISLIIINRIVNNKN